MVSHDFKIDQSDMVIVRFDTKWAEGGGWECKQHKLTQERYVLGPLIAPHAFIHTQFFIQTESIVILCCLHICNICGS